MKQYQFNTFGKKIIPTEVPIPIPKDNEIIIKTLFCGVCHSDVHLHEGFFDLGQDQKLEIPAQLPVVMGHEVLGEVVRVGKKVTGVKLRKKYVVYPWIGCGDCISCLNGDEHYCMLPNNIGINVSGGYAEYISVPNKKYLFEKGEIKDELAGSYACSGLTAYSAIKKLMPAPKNSHFVIIGAGGVGMMGIQILQNIFKINPIVLDISENVLNVVKNMGVKHVIDSKNPNAIFEVLDITGGGALRSIDFVGSIETTNLALNCLSRGGKCVVSGLFGGQLSTPLPLVVLMAKNIIGNYVGSLEEMSELMGFARQGKIEPIPVSVRSAKNINDVLKELKEGSVVGRIAISHTINKEKETFSSQFEKSIQKKNIRVTKKYK